MGQFIPEDWFPSEEILEFLKQNKVEGSKEILVLTPAFFAGLNREGDELEYRVGLEKEDKRIRFKPVIIRKSSGALQAKILSHLSIAIILQIKSLFESLFDVILQIKSFLRNKIGAPQGFLRQLEDQLFYEISDMLDEEWHLPPVEELHTLLSLENDLTEWKENKLKLKAKTDLTEWKEIKLKLLTHSNREVIINTIDKDFQSVIWETYVDENVIKLLIEYAISSPLCTLRERAIWAYRIIIKKQFKFFDPAVLPQITALLKDSDADVREEALRILKIIYEQKREEALKIIYDRETTENVIALLGDPGTFNPEPYPPLDVYEIIFNETAFVSKIVIDKLIELFNFAVVDSVQRQIIRLLELGIRKIAPTRPEIIDAVLQLCKERYPILREKGFELLNFLVREYPDRYLPLEFKEIIPYECDPPGVQKKALEVFKFLLEKDPDRYRVLANACTACGGVLLNPLYCNSCGRPFCAKHAYVENHDCDHGEWG